MARGLRRTASVNCGPWMADVDMKMLTRIFDEPFSSRHIHQTASLTQFENSVSADHRHGANAIRQQIGDIPNSGIWIDCDDG
jgi:hypothetical protein